MDEGIHCLPAKEIVILKKCGHRWMESGNKENSCQCAEGQITNSPFLYASRHWIDTLLLTKLNAETETSPIIVNTRVSYLYPYFSPDLLSRNFIRFSKFKPNKVQVQS